MQLAEIIGFIGPEETIVGTPGAQITELAIDSRKVTAPERTLFFAIETEKNDGHLYIPSLYQLGVRNFVITKVMETYTMCEGANFLFVEDSVAALQRLAQKHRQQFHYPVIGITGSNGKTIVKEWLTSILDDKYKVVKSPDSYNSRLGVPLSVWQMSDQHDIAVFEAGISRPNEMRVLADIIDPTIGILTNIGAAHAQFFPSNNRKIIEKLKISEEKMSHMEKDIAAAEKELDDDAESIITNDRYEYITTVLKKCYKKKSEGALTISDKIDRVVTNRILALPIFAAIMFLIYAFVMMPVPMPWGDSLGTIVTDWANDGVFGDGWYLFGIGRDEYDSAMDEYAEKNIWTEERKILFKTILFLDLDLDIDTDIQEKKEIKLRLNIRNKECIYCQIKNLLKQECQQKQEIMKIALMQYNIVLPHSILLTKKV